MNKMERPFEKVMKDHGYDTVKDFAKACNMYPQAVFRHVRENIKPSVDCMFVYAKVLNVDFDCVLDIFYHEQLEELNQLFGD